MKTQISKAWLQELKNNRKTQAALLMFVAVIGYLGYELIGKKTANQKPRTRAAAVRYVIGQPLDDAQMAALQGLPNLAGLHQAGEMPGEDRMYRDLFRYDMPPPPPPPPPPPQPPPPPPPPKPPPTPEEVAEALLKAEKAKEDRGKPDGFQPIAALQGMTGPMKGVFKKGDEIQICAIGEELTPNWKLVAITDEDAEFQNTRFGDLKLSLKFQSASGSSSGSRRDVSNLY